PRVKGQFIGELEDVKRCEQRAPGRYGVSKVGASAHRIEFLVYKCVISKRRRPFGFFKQRHLGTDLFSEHPNVLVAGRTPRTGEGIGCGQLSRIGKESQPVTHRKSELFRITFRRSEERRVGKEHRAKW